MRLLLFFMIVISISYQPISGDSLNKLENVIQYEKPKGELKDLFYPVGFSNKSHFAYLKIPADEAIGCYLWEFNIVNLINDKVIYKEGFDHNDCGIVNSYLTLLKKNTDIFKYRIKKYGINIRKMRIEKFPLNTGKDVFTAFLKKVKITKEKFRTKTVYSVIIKSEINGKKRVGFIKEEDVGFPLVYNLGVNGYIKSPVENRIVVVVEKEMRGYEGPPNVSKFRIYGASLNVGFKKTRKHLK
ncbi:MAG: hypothetical protein GY714_25585 [Desulfobacterales bacterium]|nr:hypothetical protein [Desulfobacterales bacterium]